MTSFVFDFAQGNKDQRDLLGGKGANLAEMTNLGLPVPPGFTITTEACNAYMAGGNALPPGLMDEVSAARHALFVIRGVESGRARRVRPDGRFFQEWRALFRSAPPHFPKARVRLPLSVEHPAPLCPPFV